MIFLYSPQAYFVAVVIIYLPFSEHRGDRPYNSIIRDKRKNRVPLAARSPLKSANSKIGNLARVWVITS